MAPKTQAPAIGTNRVPVQRVHAKPLRGLVNATASSTRESRFGRMFRGLPEFVPHPNEQRALAAEIAEAMLSSDELTGGAAAAEAEVLEAGGDDEENPRIPSGYTYLGQFIDHDITFDPVSSLDRQNDPDALHTFRTPRLDLDNVYGAGPDDQPYLYEDDGARLVLGGALTGSPDKGARDLPRLGGRAVIGDPRNDENVIVAQLHAIVLRFHNAVVEALKATGVSGPDLFPAAQREVRWHYQWVVIHDFLVKICGKAVVDDILGVQHCVVQDANGGPPARISLVRPRFLFFNPIDHAFMPVEFSGALYRFGHSMVRPFYRLNTKLPAPFPTFDTTGGAATGLTGFQPMAGHPVRGAWAIDWSLFFDTGKPLQRQRKVGELTTARIQPSYQVDTSIAFPLGGLPSKQFGSTNPPSLAQRNIMRGFTLGLPCGQAVAHAMGLRPLAPEEILIGPDEADKRHDGKPQRSMADIADGRFAEETPLWVYVLAEAQRNMEVEKGDSGAFENRGSGTLGPVGARLVAEVIIGLIARDRFSYLTQAPNWRPTRWLAKATDSFGMPELVNAAIKG